MRFGGVKVVWAAAVTLLSLTQEVLGARLPSASDDVVDAGNHREKRSEESSVGQWSIWFNMDRPWSGEGDFETIDAIIKTQRICSYGKEVSAVECRVAGSNDTFDSTSTAFVKDHLLQACSSLGLICLNNQQQSGMCQDYEVRFLCQEPEQDDSSHGSLFPSFDFKIYIILAVVPLFIVAMRIIWSCCCKERFKRRQLRDRRRHRESVVSTSSSSSTDSDGSIDSSLANPPPAYTDLFGSVQQPVVFSISGGECVGCGKCMHHGHSAEVRGVNLVTSGVVSEEGAGDGGEGSSSQIAEDSDAVFDPPSSDTNSGDTVTTQNQSEQTPEVRRPSLISHMSVLGAAGLPVTQLTAPEAPRNTPCTCSCHHVNSGHMNMAFHWEAGDHVDVSQPAVYPGMHKPVFSFSRIGSESSFASLASFTSFTEPPDYEEALEILKKSGLFMNEQKVPV